METSLVVAGLVVGGLLALALLLLLAGLAYHALGTERDKRRFPPPGRLVDVGGHRLHIHAMGGGAPTVVMDSGLPGTVLSWGEVQPAVARFTRVASYDRAGLGWSEPGPEPRTAQRIAEELHTLLANAGLAPPYVLVGHSFGGLTTRLFAGLYPDEVDGLILIDPAYPEDWLEENLSPEQKGKLRGGARLARYGALLARLGLARLTALLGRMGGPGAAQSFVAFLTGGAVRTGGNLVAPIARLQPELRPVAGAFWKQPKVFAALAAQVESLTVSAAQVAAGSIAPELPLVILTAESAEPAQKQRGEQLARCSRRGQQVVVPGSGHWIHLDQPVVVVDAIRRLVEETRSTAQVRLEETTK